MMTSTEISSAIKTRRKFLSIDNLFCYYAPVFFLSFFVFLDLFQLVRKLILGIKPYYLVFKLEIGMYHVFFFLAILIYLGKYLSLNFYKFELEIPRSEFQKEVVSLIEELNWRLVEKGNSYMLIESELIPILSQNELVTIIFTDKFLLVNSISNPDNLRSLFTYGRNRENLNNIKTKLKNK